MLLSCEALICSSILDFGSTYVSSHTHTVSCRRPRYRRNDKLQKKSTRTNHKQHRQQPYGRKANTSYTVKNLNAMFAANRRPNVKYDKKDDEDDRDSAFISCFEHRNTKKPARRTRRREEADESHQTRWKTSTWEKNEKKQSKQAIQIRRRNNRSSRTNNQKKIKDTKTGEESEYCGRQLLT